MRRATQGEGPSGQTGPTSDRGTGGLFGSTTAVCHLADSHYLVNKRAVSFFSGSHMQRSWPSQLWQSNAETMHQNLFGPRHSVSSHSDAKCLSLSQLDACWWTHVPSSVGGACDSPADKARCVILDVSPPTTAHSAQPQEPCPRYIKHGSFEIIGRVYGCLVKPLCYVHKCPCGSACFFSLSPACSLSVNLLGRLPWLLIGSWSCHSSLSDMTPTYPLPVKFPLADKRTLKGMNGDLSFALCICCHFTHFWLALFVISLCQNPLCFVLTFLILITFWFAILFG